MIASAMDIRIRAAGASDTGRVRHNNQDAFGFDLDRGLFLVCDGVGGERAGDVASRLVVDTVIESFPSQYDPYSGHALQRVIQRANRAIYDAAETEPRYRGMSTTVVSAHFDGSRMWIAHVGDSRAYLLRDGALHQLTEDHSVLAQRLRNGYSHGSPEEARRLEGVLTQALGAGDFVVPDVTTLHVNLGDCFLLASDGLTRPLRRSELLALLIASTSPEHACQQLVRAANQAGGEDNITCLVVQID